MKNPFFLDQTTKELFKQNDLAQFDQLWQLESEWFEKPNYRRNGWSGVIKYPLKDDKGNIIYAFIKRQENHNFKTLLHPINGIPTFRREFINIQRLKQKKIPTLTSLYYGERSVDNKSQSILVTRSLDGYQSFEDFFHPDNHIPQETSHKIMRIAGQNTRRLHDACYRHGSLYPKHFFVTTENDTIDVRFIDLEKLKRYPFSYLVRHNDLSRIIRHRRPLDKQAIQVFITTYLTTGKNLEKSRLSRKLSTLLEKS